ncbi:hypothetical protein Q8F55_003330 [Vanrija albida]|uniref:Amino acid permease/ SLC12A domain-containing protein n=1 Tax=Vanrija albida TaxID=181172 RepID=A0ABR3Q3W3_9TREE
MTEKHSSAPEPGAVEATPAYTPVLARTFGQLESWAASFCAMNFIGVTRMLLFVGLACGGPPAVFTSCVVTIFGVSVTAAVLAEVCSALPLNGSIYVWASEAAGRRYGRLAGFVVGWWASTAWISFVASNSQAPAQYLLSLSVIFDEAVPGGFSPASQAYRGVLFAVSLACMWVAIGLNYLPPRFFKWTFRFTVGLLFLDLLLSITWLPVGVSRTYGFRSASEVFTKTSNATGFGFGWAWALSFFYGGYTTCGYDAAGHVSEETKAASTTSARGIFYSALSSSVLTLISTVVWLFCIPPIDQFYAYTAPQPFVQVWNDSIGRGGAVFMTVLAVLGAIMSTSCAVTASSRLIFAVARDGILPGSKWIATPNAAGVPTNAVTVIAGLSTALLLVSIGSQVAFTSLLSAAAVGSISAYALIAACRFAVTPNEFKHTKWSLGRWGPAFYVLAFAWNLFLLCVLYSPLGYPFTAKSFNFAIVIMAGVSVFGIISWWLVPEDRWLRPALIDAMRKVAFAEEEVGVKRESDRVKA